MKFLDHAGLSRLSVLLDDLDVGDRLLRGSLVLFSTVDEPEENDGCQAVTQKSQLVAAEAKTAKRRRLDFSSCSTAAVASHPPNVVPYAAGSPAGLDQPAAVGADAEAAALPAQVLLLSDRPSPIEKCNSTRRPSSQFREAAMLAHLVGTLNVCFPDYDFSCVSPEAFERVGCLVSVYTSINHRLSFLVERVLPGFLDDLWIAIRDAINLSDASVYSYTNTNRRVEADPFQDDDNCLFNFDYFFVDEKAKKLLFFTCMTRRVRNLITCQTARKLQKATVENLRTERPPRSWIIVSQDDHWEQFCACPCQRQRCEPGC